MLTKCKKVFALKNNHKEGKNYSKFFASYILNSEYILYVFVCKLGKEIQASINAQLKEYALLQMEE